jgi:hypothetical protein
MDTVLLSVHDAPYDTLDLGFKCICMSLKGKAAATEVLNERASARA